MKIWINDSFDGHYPIGTGAIVIAKTKKAAAKILSKDLVKEGLEPAKPEDFHELEFKLGNFYVTSYGQY